MTIPFDGAPVDADRRQHDEGCPDERAWRARHHRLLQQVEQALERAGGHRDEHPDWRTVTTILERLHCELSRDLCEVRAGAAQPPRVPNPRKREHRPG